MIESNSQDLTDNLVGIHKYMNRTIGQGSIDRLHLQGCRGRKKNFRFFSIIFIGFFIAYFLQLLNHSGVGKQGCLELEITARKKTAFIKQKVGNVSIIR